MFHATVNDIDPDVIGITESWATENILDSELSMRGYQLFRCDRSTGNRGGGVLLYVKSVWQPVAFDVLSTYGEHIWCRIGETVIGVCYRSGNLNIVGQDNSKQLLNVLTEVSSRQVLIMGDF